MQGPPCLLFGFGCTIVVLLVPCAGFVLLVGCVHSLVDLIAPLLCYEYPAQGPFC